MLKALKLSTLGLMMALSTSAYAEKFPDRSIRIVLPFAVGGGVDALVRPLAKEMSEILGQSVFIDAKPSANGQLGMREVARAEPDGYTIVVSAATYAITPAFFPDLPYDTLADFAPITIVASNPLALVASKDFPANSIQEMIDLAKTSRGVNFAAPGVSGVHYLAAQLLATEAGVKWQNVPYKGAGNAFPDLIGGQVDVMFDNPGSSLPHVDTGRLKLIATTGMSRSPVTPHAPTVSETIKGFDASNWFILSAPSNTPPDRLATLNSAVAKAIQTPAMQQVMQRNGIAPIVNSPSEANKFVHDEVKKWRKVVDDNGLKAE
jgi:tripartite-type tricarboxylate transporter receptor subunit TctC